MQNGGFMKFFIDTANVDDIRKANDMGVICGVTTNPSLIAKEGRDFNEVIKEITSIVDGPISGEVKATTVDAEGMIKEGREIAAIHPNMVVKIPMTIEGLKAVKVLSAEGIKEVKPYLSFPGYIPNADLAALYNGAFAFLYPSLRESFGIPMLESMACGTPVIAGNTSAMPEIAGEGALLADPLDENDIARKILLLEEDDTFYQQQVDYGLERVKLFSWRKSAEALLKIYKEIIIHKPQSRGIL